MCTGIVLTALLILPLLPDRVNVELNDPAPADIFAPRSVTYPDFNRTQDMRRMVGERVPAVFSEVVGANADARTGVTSFFEEVVRVQRTVGLSLEKQVARLKQATPGLAAAEARQALVLLPTELTQAKTSAELLITQLMESEVPEDAVSQVRESARQKAAALKLPGTIERLIGEVVALNVIPNRFLNERETEAARQRAIAEVPAQYETIKRGDLIARKGDRVTPQTMLKLRRSGLVQERLDFGTALSLAGLAFGLVAVFCFYLNQFQPDVLRSFRNLLLISVIVCGSMLLFRLNSTVLGLQFSADQLGFVGMVSSAVGAMLIASLLCPQIAVFVGVALALLTSVLVGSELRFAILSIVSSLAGVQAVTTIRNRAGIIRACLVVSVVNVIATLVAQGATQSVRGEFTRAELLATLGQSSLWAFLGGFGSVLLFMLFAAWMERPFRLTTHLTLLELSDPSHPLLRRLAMEAPGTYAHSIIVGNLSEAAAEAIGADGLFCRVASYYHDVGKVIRPHFFVENQSADNRHNQINPSLSSLIVTSHVKDGVELAEEHKLPPSMIAIIREHHGTCLIKYFYHREVTNRGDDNSSPGLEYQFRYEGPRPQTKESGIIMIADSAEAASRTLHKPTPGRIRDLIEHIVKDRMSDGQFDDCELTFKDLEKIITSMTRSLTSLLHARIEYPKGNTSELTRGDGARNPADGAASKESVAGRKALSDTPETASAPFGRPGPY